MKTEGGEMVDVKYMNMKYGIMTTMARLISVIAVAGN